MFDWLKAVGDWPIWLQFVATILTGMSASLLVPFINWRMKRAELRHNHRVQLMNSWTLGFHEWEVRQSDYHFGVRQEGVEEERDMLRLQPWYITLRPHLSDSARALLDAEGRPVSAVGTRDEHATVVRDELDRLAQEWKVA